MPRKNENVTHVRISKENLKILDTVKMGKETNREVLNRLIEDYDNRGIRRALVKKISDLQVFVTSYIHEDLHYSLEMVKEIFNVIEGLENRIERGIVCDLLNKDLLLILDKKIPKVLVNKNPDDK